MLHELTSDLSDFPPLHLDDGLNIAPARIGGAGTGLTRLLDFLLGAEVRIGHPLRRPELTHSRFRLTLDLSRRPRRVTRSADELAKVRVDEEELRLQQFRGYLGEELFALTGEGNEPSFRSVVAYYVRDATVGGFVSPTETYRKQRTMDSQPALAHLFALDVDLVAKVREVTETDRDLRELRRAAKDSVMGMALGRGNDLDAQIRSVQEHRDAIAAELAGFRMAGAYARHRERADELSRAIRKINDHLAVIERQARDLEATMSGDSAEQPDRSYLDEVYRQLGVVLPGQVIRRFDEVEAFHHSVVANRRRYLEAELARLRRDVAREESELARLDEERADLMRLLEADGALDSYAELQRQISLLDGRLSELIERRAIVDRWGNAGRHLRLRSTELEMQVSADLHDRRSRIAEISGRYASYARRLYGEDRPAGLTIEARRSGYKFVPVIEGETTEAGRAMALLCFDLCMAVTAKRSGHGPDFLVHDGRLFNPVSAPEMVSALRLAEHVCRSEGLQYVAALTPGQLNEASAAGFPVRG
ncbi:DUF2326 domain-containing protein [Actinomadura barringtoniae]|uniref:DUF2326 domain-containing protein n=1 Tax=Actinomadura barringtoniae TaxID=1427535 RepID=A0A939TBA6_9ACTN|nr:ABC-three component system protein [Actinomadura barringtoniae]MBO2453352.1 DUF2326 domain-containing protein [Actinomadura barringtoniae]